MTFCLGKQKSVKTNSKHNFMQYVFFEKGMRSVQWDVGQNPKSWRIFVNCVLK